MTPPCKSFPNLISKVSVQILDPYKIQIFLDGPGMSSGTKKVEAPEISSGGVVGKVRKSESRKSKRIGKRKEDLYSGEK